MNAHGKFALYLLLLLSIAPPAVTATDISTTSVSGVGCAVEEVAVKSAAEEVGLKVGDTIVEANGKVVRNAEDLDAIVRASQPELQLAVARNGTTEKMTAHLHNVSFRGYRLGVYCAEQGDNKSQSYSSEAGTPSAPQHLLFAESGFVNPQTKVTALDTGLFHEYRNDRTRRRLSISLYRRQIKVGIRY